MMFQPLFLWLFSKCHLPYHHLLGLWWHKYLICLVQQDPMSLLIIFHPILYCSDWVISILLLSNSLILFSVISIFLISLSSKVSVLVIAYPVRFLFWLLYFAVPKCPFFMFSVSLLILCFPQPTSPPPLVSSMLLNACNCFGNTVVMAALKYLSGNSNICVILVLTSVDCLFSFKLTLSWSWYDEWRFIWTWIFWVFYHETENSVLWFFRLRCL